MSTSLERIKSQSPRRGSPADEHSSFSGRLWQQKWIVWAASKIHNPDSSACAPAKYRLTPLSRHLPGMERTLVTEPSLTQTASSVLYQWVFLFRREAILCTNCFISVVLNRQEPIPTQNRCLYLWDALSSYGLSCCRHLSLTSLCQWKIRLHFSMLIATSPKQCNQGLMCTYNFILDISLTAIYCLKGKGKEGEGEGTPTCPPPPKQTQQLYVWRQSLCKVQKKMAIIMGFTYVLS